MAPDGSAGFALGRCRLARAATPDGPLTFTRIPVPARHVAFDPVGGLWLTSGARLVHVAPTEPAGACDETPPTVRVTPRGRVSVGALRRSGLRIAVREPAAISALAFYRGPGEQFDVGDVLDTNVERARGGSVRYRVPRAILRRFARAVAAGRDVEVGLLLSVTDREGNANEVSTGPERVTLERGPHDALELVGGGGEVVVVDDVREVAGGRELGLGDREPRRDLLRVVGAATLEALAQRLL